MSPYEEAIWLVIYLGMVVGVVALIISIIGIIYK